MNLSYWYKGQKLLAIWNWDEAPGRALAETQTGPRMVPTNRIVIINEDLMPEYTPTARTAGQPERTGR